MTLNEALPAAFIFTCVCLVALLATIASKHLPAPKAKPSCQWVATEVRPASFEVRRGVRYERAAYEVDVLQCEGGTITVRR